MNEYFEFEVILKNIKPKIWRRFLLPKSATFSHLHDAIQNACGWTNSHLYSFTTAGGRFKEEIASSSYTDNAFDRESPPSNKVKLASYFEMYEKCIYVYDFGDHWEHEIKLKKVVQDPSKFKRRLLAGKRAFPLEDCGSIPGYSECVDFVIGGKKNNPDLEDWISENWHPEAFDLEEMKKNFDN